MLAPRGSDTGLIDVAAVASGHHGKSNGINIVGPSNAEPSTANPGMYQLDIVLRKGHNLAIRDRGGVGLCETQLPPLSLRLSLALLPLWTEDQISTSGGKRKFSQYRKRKVSAPFHHSTIPRGSVLSGGVNGMVVTWGLPRKLGTVTTMLVQHAVAEVFRSRTIHKNLNPVWEEKVTLLVDTLREPLYVKNGTNQMAGDAFWELMEYRLS
ncbi:hypothetical protein JZ751_001033 [Albula glossodonta]|uniref:C2 domain-containing protein n=1 Tax=Albula glossodonta TaxID=121402 RepID=A0A8T2PSP2_9TELE|nr:hypothetical protein JZ751_001033 [Albula glossodonta]